MNRLFQSRLVKSMVPYFILAVAVIIAFHVVSEIGIFLGFFSRIWDIINPFFMGLVLAYILNLPCGGIQRLLKRTNNPVIIKRSRPLAVLILMIIVITLTVVLLNLIIPALIRSITQFVNEFDSHLAGLQSVVVWFNNLDLPEFIPDLDLEDGAFSMIQEFVQDFDPAGITASIVAGFGGAFAGLFRTFLAVVSSIYLLIEMERLNAFTRRLIKAVFSEKKEATILKYCGKLNFNFKQYIYVQTIDGLILGTLMTITLYLFGSQFALVLGIMLGIVNYIPYFGSIFGTAVAVIVVAFTQGLGTAAFAAIVMFAIQQLDGNVIQPKLMGGSFSLSPLLVIISVTVGGAYAGMLGMLVAIPIVAVLKDILDGFIEERELKKAEATVPDDDVVENNAWWV